MTPGCKVEVGLPGPAACLAQSFVIVETAELMGTRDLGVPVTIHSL